MGKGFGANCTYLVGGTCWPPEVSVTGGVGDRSVVVFIPGVKHTKQVMVHGLCGQLALGVAPEPILLDEALASLQSPILILL